MSSEPMSSSGRPGNPSEKHSFFRQGGWMIVATVINGALMLGVHFLSKRIPNEEYSLFGALLAVTIMIPTVPLQMVFTQQTAAALASGRQRQLAGTVRAAALALFLLWFVGALVVWGFSAALIEHWQIRNPAALWLTVVVALGCLWWPVVMGMLQGAQDFLWLGWVTILHAASRLGAAGLIVLVLHGEAAGIMVGVLFGLVVSSAIGAWRSRAFWSGPSESSDRRELLRQVVPLMLGFGACFFLFTADTMFVKAMFPAQAPAYVAAGTLSRALVWLVLPLSVVMFPKIVHSTVRSEKSNLMIITLVCTAILAALGAAGLWLVAPWVVPFVFPKDFLRDTMTILPWYAGAMIPLALANVLVNDLLARGQYRVVPWMVAVAAAYGFILTRLHTSLVQVPQALASFCALLFVICILFSRAKPSGPGR